MIEKCVGNIKIVKVIGNETQQKQKMRRKVSGSTIIKVKMWIWRALRAV